jgi:hypothetical protein
MISMVGCFATPADGLANGGRGEVCATYGRLLEGMFHSWLYDQRGLVSCSRIQY